MKNYNLFIKKPNEAPQLHALSAKCHIAYYYKADYAIFKANTW